MTEMWLGALLFASVLLVEALAAEVPYASQYARNPSFSVGGTVLLSASSPEATRLQWRKNGLPIAGANGPGLTIESFQPFDAGVYTVEITEASRTEEKLRGIIAPQIEAKVAGAATEVGSDIVHPNGRIYDQMLLTGAAASIRADPEQVTRVSFVDLDDDIVQVEFSGAGTLTLVLSAMSAAAPAVNYNQPSVSYVKGHASLFVAGADETTNVSVFTVGRLTAVNQGLIRPEVSYDGIADIGLIAVAGRESFGGIRAANAAFFAGAGLTGIYAPTLWFSGPIWIGELQAADAAWPTLSVRSVSKVQIAGGETVQLNGRMVHVSGLASIRHEDGMTSAGELLPAQASRARFWQSGDDVTTGMLDAEPKALQRTPPYYPFQLWQAGITGETLIEFVVTPEGRVEGAFAVSATRGEFAAAAIWAISQWLFEPGRRLGVAVSTRMQQPITFMLSP